MNSMRWNWVVIVVAGGICLFVGVAGALQGAFGKSDEPTVFLTMGVVFVLFGLLFRRSYKRYEAKAMELAAEDIEYENRSVDSVQRPARDNV
jgi:hypothetical protein